MCGALGIASATNGGSGSMSRSSAVSGDTRLAGKRRRTEAGMGGGGSSGGGVIRLAMSFASSEVFTGTARFASPGAANSTIRHRRRAHRRRQLVDDRQRLGSDRLRQRRLDRPEQQQRRNVLGRTRHDHRGGAFRRRAIHRTRDRRGLRWRRGCAARREQRRRGDRIFRDPRPRSFARRRSCRSPRTTCSRRSPRGSGR